MVYEIENEYMKVGAETLGAQPTTITRKDGNIEHLWQGDAKYWKSRSPHLFPVVGRLYEGKYEYDGKLYALNIHGFARNTEFTLVEKTADSMVFAISATAATTEIYPFDFIFKVKYALIGNTLTMTYIVENTGKSVMYFGLGGHTGFNVPFDGGEFTDYYLETENACSPEHLLLSPSYLMSENRENFSLENGKILHLKHELFVDDAIVLEGFDRTVSIKSKKTKKSIKVSFPKMHYVGLWHAPKTDAPYLCIEPWENLPSFDGKIEKLNEKPHIGKLESGEIYESPIIISLE